MCADSFLWHDYETFGTDPRRDRPCQFAAWRTDTALRPVGDPLVVYAQPTSDVLPVPEACMVTGITPQLARERGVPEYEFAERIREQMSFPGTCIVGFNNFRFDDEVTRFLFWRNLIDPYAHEYKNGNSRFDLIDVLRMGCALRPEGMNWPKRDDGAPSFRLETLAEANGLDIGDAHDALADVRNTLELARRFRTAQPRLWEWALGLRDRAQAEGLLMAKEPVLHVSARFPAEQYCIAPVLPLFQHPEIRNQWLVWNLRVEPGEFVGHDADLLQDLLWTSEDDLPEGFQRLPIKWVRINRCPMLAPMNVLDSAAGARTGIDEAQARRNAEKLAAHPEFIARLASMLGGREFAPSADAETALYDGFVPDPDRRLAERLRLQPLEALAAQVDSNPFADPRLNELLLHYVGRHAPGLLSPPASAAWQAYRRRRLYDDPELATIRMGEFHERIALLRARHPEHAPLWSALEDWARELESI